MHLISQRVLKKSGKEKVGLEGCNVTETKARENFQRKEK